MRAVRWFVVLAVLVACGSEPAPKAAPPTHDLTGTLKAPECEGGYDIVGAAVTVRDDADNVIGASTTHLMREKTGFAGLTVYCLVGFSMTDLPERDFYQFEIGTHDGPAYSLDEMNSFDWNIKLTLD